MSLATQMSSCTFHASICLPVPTIRLLSSSSAVREKYIIFRFAFLTVLTWVVKLYSSERASCQLSLNYMAL
jgi:hypothetical protein